MLTLHKELRKLYVVPLIVIVDAMAIGSGIHLQQFPLYCATVLGATAILAAALMKFWPAVHLQFEIHEDGHSVELRSFVGGCLAMRQRWENILAMEWEDRQVIVDEDVTDLKMLCLQPNARRQGDWLPGTAAILVDLNNSELEQIRTLWHQMNSDPGAGRRPDVFRDSSGLLKVAQN